MAESCIYSFLLYLMYLCEFFFYCLTFVPFSVQLWLLTFHKQVNSCLLPQVCSWLTCTGDMVASSVDVKVCLLSPLTGIQLWFNVLSDIITRCVNMSPWYTTELSTVVFVFYVDTNVISEVLMSSCVC